MRIMISAAASPVACSIMQHLRSLGHQVDGHDMRAYGAIIKSPPVSNSDAYKAFLMTGIECDLYLPFLDEELELIGECTPPFPVATSAPSLIGAITNKMQQQISLEAFRLPVAYRTTRPPAIFKPIRGRGGRGMIVVNSEADRDIFDVLKGRQGFVSQTLIDGDEYTVDVLCDLHGELVQAVPRRRVVAQGVSVIGRIEMAPDAISVARSVTEMLRFKGPINIQMIRDAHGVLHIIEINPRLSGSCMFTVMAGFDILDATVRLFTGQPLPAPQPVKEITIVRHYREEIVG